MAAESKISRWEQFKLRLKSEAESTLVNNRQSGIAIVTAHVLMDASGTPLVWVVPEAKRVEPSRDAASIIKQLTDSL